ncbi:hypothetical protein [Massilia alkalitolerans]|uniref:hypothetical protein n=1 Tax=Massilia alkalitolerans TaxID=286638 RepID=UPI0028AA83B8|nr:hypothetical protein [Massilia alkalitolerans]
MTLTHFALCWALLSIFLPHAAAQSQLPAPSRTIYKCQVKGSVSYSDKPCVGAQRLDVVPTRGADRLSGSKRIGNDVANEGRSEQFAQALKPLTGMNPSHFATASRRQHLDAASQSECRQLEAAILTSEQAERSAGVGMMESIRQDLFSLRKRYKKMDC